MEGGGGKGEREIEAPGAGGKTTKHNVAAAPECFVRSQIHVGQRETSKQNVTLWSKRWIDGWIDRWMDR